MRVLIVFAALLLAPVAHAAQLPPAAAASPAAQDPAAQDPAVYMAGIAKQPGVVVTDSGLAYKITRSGAASGLHPRLGDQVRVGYEGRLTDGTVFDSSAANGGPLVMTVGQLVPGWNEALQLMRPGDDWTLYVPPGLGYGDQPTGPIPANSVMVFRLQLLAIVPPDAGP
jgi:peptidylprolyl isomerase/FKBP-type peptidyl-prolyl cis-trans isomerase FklB